MGVDARARTYSRAPEADTRTAQPDAGARSSVYVQRFAVEFQYAVHFTRDLFDPSNATLVTALSEREPTRLHRVFAVVESQVLAAWPGLLDRIRTYFAAHGERITLVAEPVVVTGGEASKNDVGLIADLQRRMHDVGLDRQSFVVCVGGGALQDAVGYAAATTHRGVRMVRVPTTVLAQNDSGVGVKNAINAFGKKNFLGTFAPPFAVLNDFRFLETLDRRDKVAGMSEAVKVALIRDEAFFEWLVEHRDALAECDAAALEVLVRRCAELHMRHIATSGDAFEFGSARPLDFGHWAAHKLESMTDYRLRHGEAVAIGIGLDTLYSALAGFMSMDDAVAVLDLLAGLGLPLWDDALDARGDDGRRLVLAGLDEFREHLGGELTVTLLRGIGRGFEVNEMDEAWIEDALARLREASRQRAAHPDSYAPATCLSEPGRHEADLP